MYKTFVSQNVRGNERNEGGGRGREWHDGVIDALPFHIEIRGSQMCEDRNHIGSRARAQSGHRRACGMELVSCMQGARFRQHASMGRTRTTCDLLTGLQIRKYRFIYAILPWISSRYLPIGRQDCSTSIFQQSSARTALFDDKIKGEIPQNWRRT